jgi:hypothetical protein
LAAWSTTVLAGLVPLWFYTRYFFLGDTQAAYFGELYHFGELLRSGEWPMLDPSAWRGGAYLVEGQWGLFSPLTMLIAVLSTLVEDMLAFVIGVKLFFLSAASLGSYLLARSYDVPRPAAYVVGVAVPLGGLTMYFDLPSWLAGLMVWSMLPWAWWSMRRMMLRQANPFPVLVIGFLIVTVGYVFGTLLLAVVLAGCILDAVVARRWGAAAKVVVVGVCTGLVALTVYLPGLLSSGVTEREVHEIRNIGFMVADVGGLVSSSLPTALAGMKGWWGDIGVVPLMYIAWFLPLLVCVDWRRVSSVSRDLAGLGLFWLVTLAWIVGPSGVGPIRFPARILPYFVLATVLAALVLFSRARLRHPSRARLVAALGLVAAAAYLSTAQVPERWRTQLATAAVVAVGVVVTWLLVRGDGLRRGSPRAAAAAAFVGVWCVLLVGVQHHYFPRPTQVDWGMPTRLSAYDTQAAQATGDVLVIGRTGNARFRNGAARDTVLSNMWHLTPHRVHNVHAIAGFAAYGKRYCMDYHGFTCPEALDRVLSAEPVTGATRADLLSVSTLYLIKGRAPADRLHEPPDGWHVAGENDTAVTWVRDDPLPVAGGVVWSSPGTSVTELSMDARKARFRVDAVPPGGGQVALSRLAWPGYRVAGASLGDPIEDYLLTVDVPAGSAGTVVTVDYAPPAWRFEVACLVVAVSVGLLWSLMEAARAVARRRRRRVSTASGSARAFDADDSEKEPA